MSRDAYHIIYKEKLKEISSRSLAKRKLIVYLFVDQPTNMWWRDTNNQSLLVSGRC